MSYSYDEIILLTLIAKNLFRGKMWPSKLIEGVYIAFGTMVNVVCFHELFVKTRLEPVYPGVVGADSSSRGKEQRK